MDNKTQEENIARTRSLRLSKKVIAYIAGVVLAAAVLVGGWYGYLYASTPGHLRIPAYQHYHFRTQIMVNGKAVDFSREEFQVASSQSTACSAEVGSTPIDFHDNLDQLTHVHWNGITGGEFLKYYGWNLIGGSDEILGQRYDNGVMPTSVGIFGKLLPTVADGADFYVYVGDQNNYQQKNWDDFMSQDLEVFFGKESKIGHGEGGTHANVLSWLFPKASAHGGVVDEHLTDKSDEELARINNLIGNVVIFAQENEPTKEQIQARFDSLVSLPESTCGD